MREWLKGLISAVSGAVSATVTLIIVDPATFNFEEGLGKLLIAAAVSAVTAVLNYLAKSPWPEKESYLR